MSSKNQTAYSIGQDSSVHRTFLSRTAESCSYYLLPHLTSTSLKLLDVGCGPDSITADFARILNSGHVTGIDQAHEAVEQAAKTAAERGLTNVSFEVGDAAALPFPDAAFDVVHTHHVLYHLPDPVKALKEMKRVTKPGGLIAYRDGIMSTLTIYPMNSGLSKWKDVVYKTMESEVGDVDGGCKLQVWAREAGLKIEWQGASCIGAYGRDDRIAMAEVLGKRGMGKRAVELGIASQDQLNEAVMFLGAWVENDDSWMARMSGEILCRV
jgi:ubiquinone/menaquinone biosynthesis C-methylase UbiE